MSTISGTRIRRAARMRHWHSIVEEWILAHERFARFSEGDAAYWYTERANIGVLAGAAWRCGMVALEEFQTNKEAIDTEYEAPEPLQWRGRCDLWLAGERHEELIEAKHRAINLFSKDPVQAAKSTLDSAVRDAVASNPGSEIWATGIAFLPVIYRKGACSKEDFQEHFENLLLQLKPLNPDLLAWCLPDATRELNGPKGKFVWPGILLLGRSMS